MHIMGIHFLRLLPSIMVVFFVFFLYAGYPKLCIIQLSTPVAIKLRASNALGLHGAAIDSAAIKF